MCGRFSQAERVDRIAELFGADPDPGLPDGGYNIAPTDPIRIVREITGSRRISAASWGFRPFWLGPDRRRAPGWINARSETAAGSPAFGPALRSSRCVIPADAFYEWDRAHQPPQPYAIGSAADGMLAFAGLWADPPRADLDGVSDLPSATILTTGPNAVLAPLHHRMPVLLDRREIDAWLDLELPLPAVLAMLDPAPASAIRAWPVSLAVNAVRNEGPGLLQPVELPPTLGLGAG